MVPYKQRVQAYLTKSVDSLFRTIQFSNGVVRSMDKVVLSDLKDVSNTAPGDGDVLEWSAAQGKWVPGPGGGGVIPTLQQVMDQGAAYTGTNNFSMASATSNVTDQGFNLALGNASGALASSSIYAAQSLQHLSTGTSGTAELTLDANGSVDLNWKSGTTTSGFTIDGTQMLVTDANNTKGLEYAADYSGSFTARSLVDKAYVDSNVPSGVALVGTYTDGYVPRWNATTNTLQSGVIKDDGSGGIALGGVAASPNGQNGIQVKTTGSMYSGIYSLASPTSGSSSYGIQAGAQGSTLTDYALAVVGRANPSTSMPDHTAGIYGLAGSSYFPAPTPFEGTFGVIGQVTSTFGGTILAGVGAHVTTTTGTKHGVYSKVEGTGTANIGGYFEATGGTLNYSLQLKDGSETVGGGRFLKDTGDGKAQWADVPAGATDIDGLSDGTTVGTQNLGLGANVLGGSVTGTRNTGVGINALTAITSGSSNVAIGAQAGQNMNTGGSNVLIGRRAGQQLTNKTNVIAIGDLAMSNSNPGNTGVGIGSSALLQATGQGNIGIGNSAGFSITSGQYNICLGRNANALNTGSYQIAVGQGMTTTTASSLALGRVNYTLLHGDFATQGQTKLGVNLGNTYTAPTANLEVKGHASDATTALFTNGSGGTLFQVKQNGNVGIGVDPQQELHIRGNQAIIRLEAQASTGANYLEFWDPTERKGYVGYGSSSNDQFSIVNDEHGQNVNLWTTNSGGTTVKGLEIDGNQDVTVSNGNLEVAGQAYSTTHTLTAGTTVTPDFDNGNVQTVTLGQATTLANPTNLKDGATYIVIVKQPAGANHTLAFGTAYKFEGGTAPTITAANGATDVLTFVSDGTNLYGAAALNFS